MYVRISALVTDTPKGTSCRANSSAIARAKNSTSKVRVNAIPRYLPITNSHRWIGLAMMVWMVLR
jgi:hypothetical protein